jgi:hypothetical protein
MYARALDDFLAWCQENQVSVTRAAVLEYRGCDYLHLNVGASTQ